MNGRVHRTLSLLLLAALTGCASGPFRHKPAPAAVHPPEAPELSQSPLYSPEMSDNDPRLPALPGPAELPVVAAAEPAAPRPKRIRKPKPTPPPARTTAPSPSRSVAAPGESNTGTPAPAGSPAAGSSDSSTAAAATDKKPGSAQIASAGSPPAASPIGELTTGSAAEAAETSHHTEDIIKSTRDGLDNLKRALSSEEKTTAAEIRTFLTRAQQALKNGDVDGAFGLATKAKLLLDELTGT